MQRATLGDNLRLIGLALNSHAEVFYSFLRVSLPVFIYYIILSSCMDRFWVSHSSVFVFGSREGLVDDVVGWIKRRSDG